MKKVRALEIKKMEDGSFWVRFSNKPKKFVKVSEDNDIIIQYIVHGMVHGR